MNFLPIISSLNNRSNDRIAPDAPPIVKLPKEILNLICGHLNNSKDLVQFGSTCHKFYYLASNSLLSAPLWKLFLCKDFPDSYSDLKSESKSLTLYKRLTNVVLNMKAGTCRLEILKHEKAVTCMTILDGMLISGSLDHTIKIWDLNTGKEIRTLKGHHSEISCMTTLDGMLISGSVDHTIKIWDLNTGKKIRTLNGHQNEINCMTILDGMLISGSADHTIKVWDLNTGKEIRTLNGHQKTITCMTILDGMLISGSVDHTIKIWDPNTGQEIRTLNGHEYAITCMTILDGMLISGSTDCTIKIWDLLKPDQEPHTLIGGTGWISCMTILDGKLIFGSRDGTIKILDLKTGQEPQTLTGHQSAIQCMTILDGKLVSGSKDGMIKIWDLKTGQELQTLNGHKDLITCMKTFDGKLISGSDDSTINVWDFNFPSLSPYSKQILEDNLEILKKMDSAWELPTVEQPTVFKELSKQLHPDFKQRLQQHSLKVWISALEILPSFKTLASFPCCEAISHTQTEVCLEALLDAIHDVDYDRINRLWKQLIEIPVFKQLFENDPKIRTIYNLPGKPVSNAERFASILQKEKAVINLKQVLKEKWSEGLPPLLVDLGVVTKEAYSQKLKCTPDHLSKIGICSPADLQALGLFKNSFHFDYLKIISEEEIESPEQPQGMILIKKSEDTAFSKKDVVFLLLEGLLNATEKMVKEAEHGALFYETGNIWIAFQNKLNSVHANLNMKCQTRRGLLSMFNQKSYANIVRQMNALIDEFQSVNREHQIALLSNYVNQQGIFKVWNEIYKPQGIKSLAALLEQKDIAPQDLFRMGI